VSVVHVRTHETSIYMFIRYENVDETGIQSMVNLVKEKSPRLWEFLPRFEQGIIQLLRGEGCDDELVEQLCGPRGSQPRRRWQ
jgi:hypothetical protein